MREKLFLIVLGLACLLFLLGTSMGLADEIILVNGNILTGEIVKLEGGKLTIKTDYSQPIEVETAKIKKVTTDKPVDVYLVSGEVLKGKIMTVEEGKIAVEPAPGQTPTTVEWPKVASMVTPPKVPPKWKGNIAIGATQQSGNTERKGASVGAEAIRKTDMDRFTFRFLWNYAEDKDDITARNTYGLLKYDYFFTKKVYAYLALEGYNDKFKDWRFRYVVGPGVGYQIWDDEVKMLLVEGGVAYSYEDRYAGQNFDYMAARLAADFRYKFGKYVTFADQLVIYPSLKYGGEYTLRNEASLLSPLGASWSLKFSNIFERNSDPPPGVEKDDVQWILALQYSF